MPFNNLVCVGRFVILVFQLNLSFPVITELVRVLTNRWWSSVRPAALLRWSDIKSKTRCGNFNLHSSRFYLISWLSVQTTIAVVTAAPPCVHISTLILFFLWKLSVNTSLLRLAIDRKQSIHVMSDSAISSICISTLKQCTSCFQYIPFAMFKVTFNLDILIYSYQNKGILKVNICFIIQSNYQTWDLHVWTCQMYECVCLSAMQ